MSLLRIEARENSPWKWCGSGEEMPGICIATLAYYKKAGKMGLLFQDGRN
jgi:hypothetical protein